MYEELDELLSKRVVPQPSPFLAERIIAAALQKGRETLTLANLWRSFGDLFLLPQPAFVLAILLLTGASVDFNSQIKPMLVDSQDEVISSYAMVGDNFMVADNSEDGAF